MKNNPSINLEIQLHPSTLPLFNLFPTPSFDRFPNRQGINPVHFNVLLT
jgi:hypothetical protein